MPLPVIIDCDPGHDDALALLMLGKSPELNLLGVTVCAGNQTLEKTTHNALRVLTLAGMTTRVAAGASKPLSSKITPVADIMGESGLDGAVLPEPELPLEELSAVELIAGLLRQSREKVTLIATGPLTNIATFLTGWPSLHSKIERIVLMGGGTFGNVTPVAEFNFHTDPVAADIVFRSDIPIVMSGLDVTYQALIYEHEIEQIRKLGNPVSTATADMLAYYLQRIVQRQYSKDGAHLHDPCTVAWLLFPDLFDLEPAYVAVETARGYCFGESIIDYNGKLSGKPCNAQVMVNINREKFIALIIERLSRYQGL